MKENKLAVFEGKRIRKTIHNNEWWFSIIDVIDVLTDSSIPKRYWSDLKRKLVNEGYSELYEKIVQLKFAAADGKFYATDCANTETMFRIIQSIPSPRVEPLKRWLAKVGKERINEIEDPQLAMDMFNPDQPIKLEKRGIKEMWGHLKLFYRKQVVIFSH